MGMSMAFDWESDILLERWEDSFPRKLFSYKTRELVKPHSSVSIRSLLFQGAVIQLSTKRTFDQANVGSRGVAKLVLQQLHIHSLCLRLTM